VFPACAGGSYENMKIMAITHVFPACAGVILEQSVIRGGDKGVPRMCGGDPVEANISVAVVPCSPYVRG